MATSAEGFVIDRAGALGKLESTPQGGYRAPAVVARSGILKYTAGELRRMGLAVDAEIPDHRVMNVYNPPEVVASAADSLNDSPVTRDHPAKFVTDATWRSVARGTVSAGSASFDGEELHAQLVVQDAELLSDIENNVRREISLGYKCMTALQPGTTPQGESYDAVRSSMVVNHVAVVPRARAGHKACFALDSEWIPALEENQEKNVTAKLKINGAEVAAEDAQAAVNAALVEANDALKTVNGKLAAAEAQLAIANAKVAAAEKTIEAQDAEIEDLKSKTTAEAIDALVEARKAEEVAAAEAEARKAAVAKAGISVEGKDTTAIDAIYELLQKDDGVKGLLGTATVARDSASAKPEPKAKRPSARAAMIARQNGKAK